MKNPDLLMSPISLFLINLLISITAGTFVCNRRVVINEILMIDNIKIDNTLTSSIKDLKSSNNIVYCDVVVGRRDSSLSFNEKFEYTYKVDYLRNSELVTTKEGKGSAKPVAPTRKSNLMAPFRIFVSRKIDNSRFDELLVNFQLKNSPENVDSINLRIICDNQCFTYFIAVMKMFFFILFLTQFIKGPKNNHNTSKGINLLLIIAMFECNPLYHFHISKKPLNIFVIIDNISTALFDSYLRVFVIFLLSNFRNGEKMKNATRDDPHHFSMLPFVCFFGALFIVKLFHNFSNDISTISYTDPVTTKSPIPAFELGIEMSYFTWLIVAIFGLIPKASKSSLKSSSKMFLSSLFSIFIAMTIATIMNKIIIVPDGSLVSVEGLLYIMLHTLAYYIGLMKESNSITDIFAEITLNNDDGTANNDMETVGEFPYIKE